MKSRTLLGLAFMLAAIPFFAAGGYVVNGTLDQKKRVERQIEETNKQCIARLKTMGAVKELSAGNFEVTIKQIQDPRKALTDASVAQSLCPYRALTNFCLGDTCEKGTPGVTMKFTMANRKN